LIAQPLKKICGRFHVAADLEASAGAAPQLLAALSAKRRRSTTETMRAQIKRRVKQARALQAAGKHDAAKKCATIVRKLKHRLKAELARTAAGGGALVVG
jgi:hypothetical protein